MQLLRPSSRVHRGYEVLPGRSSIAIPPALTYLKHFRCRCRRARVQANKDFVLKQESWVRAIARLRFDRYAVRVIVHLAYLSDYLLFYEHLQTTEVCTPAVT